MLILIGGVLIALLIVVGGIVRITVQHGDPSSLITFATTALIPTVPAVLAWYSSHKARTNAANAADDAKLAASNTDGKLDIKFATVNERLNSLATKVDQHLVYHSQEDTSAGST
jgi:hypothetical protein